MSSRQLRRSRLSIALGLFACLSGVFTNFAIISCGSGGSTVGGVTPLSQTISFVTPGTQTVGTPLTLSATATSGLAVSFASSTLGVCTVSISTATFVSAGTCTITASQVGNSTYAAATPVLASFAVKAATPVTVSSIGILPTTASLTVGQSTNFSCTVTYSVGPSDGNCSYASTANPAGVGTVTASGAFTATSVGSATVIATAVKDSTKSATANVTVTQTPIVIDLISPNAFFNPTAFGPLMTITGSGFAGGELFYFSGYPNPGTVLQGTSATEIQFVLNGQMRPRFINVYGTQANGTGKSKTVPFAALGTVPIAAACNDYVFADSQGPGTVRRFNRADGSHPTDFTTATYNGGIAVDCNPDGTTNFVVFGEYGLYWSDKNGDNLQNGGVAGDSNTTLGVAANNHVGCTIEQKAWCTPLVVGSSVQKFTPAIGTPEALGMSSGCGTNTLFVLDAQGDGTSIKLYSFSVAADGTPTPNGSVVLPEFTPVSEFTQDQIENAVNWQVAPFGKSCTVAVTAPVLNASNGSVSFSLAIVNATVNKNLMTEVVPGGVPLPAGSFQILADDVHGAVDVHYADVSGAQGINRIASRLNTASAKLNTLNSTSTILAAGSVLSLDGNSIDIIGWDPLNDAAGLQLKSVPNN